MSRAALRSGVGRSFAARTEVRIGTLVDLWAAVAHHFGRLEPEAGGLVRECGPWGIQGPQRELMPEGR